MLPRLWLGSVWPLLQAHSALEIQQFVALKRFNLTWLYNVTPELLLIDRRKNTFLWPPSCMCFRRQVCSPRMDRAIVFVNLHLFFDSSDNTKHTFKWRTADQNQTASLGDLKRDALSEMPAICHAVSGSETGQDSCRKALLVKVSVQILCFKPGFNHWRTGVP